MRINTNISALNAHRQLGINTDRGTNAMERLSSGMRINRAGDDAAGLAISEKMRGQIRGLIQASRNAQDGISLIQTAEGALNETHSILQRMRELAVQSSTDTNTDDDRLEIQKEITQLTREVDRIARTTQFNTMELLDGSYEKKVFHIGANDTQSLAVDIANMRAEELGIVGSEPTGAAPSTDPTEPAGTTGATEASVEIKSGQAVAASSAAIDELDGHTTAFGTIGIVDDSSFALDGEYSLTVTASADGNTYTAALATSGGTPVGSEQPVTIGTEVEIGGLKFTITDTNKPQNGESIAVTFKATPQAEAKPGIESLEIDKDSELEGEYTLSIAYNSNGDGSVTAKLVGAEGTVGSVAITSAGEYEIEDITFTISTDNIPGSGDQAIEVEFTVTAVTGGAGGGGGNEPVDGVAVTGETTVTVDSDNFDITITGPESSAYNGITIKFEEGDASAEGAAYSSNTITITLQAGENYDADAIEGFLQALTSGIPSGLDFSAFTVAAGSGFNEATGAQWATATGIELAGGVTEVKSTTEPGATIEGKTTVNDGTADFDVTVTAPEGSAYDGITISFATGESAGAAYSEGTITITLLASESYSDEDIAGLINEATGVPEGVDVSKFTVAAGSGFDGASGTQWAAADDITLGEGEKDPAAKEVFDESTLYGINVDTQEAADKAIEAIDEAIVTVSAERSKLGAMQNRLEHTIANLGTSAENLQAAESRIRDLDMAQEIMQFTKTNILNQAATAMLAQANMAPQSVLQLLG